MFARGKGDRHVHLCNSIPHSGHAGFLNTKPTFGQQSAQNIFLHRGHCHAGGLNTPPTCLPQAEQNPLTIFDPPNLTCYFNIIYRLRLVRKIVDMIKYLHICMQRA